MRSASNCGRKSDEPPLRATADEGTESFNSEVVSQNGIFIDVEEKRILGQKDAGARINPASMTKILTVLVAAEHITNLDDTFEITIAITDYSYVNDCSNVGFDVGEKVTVRDLFYGTVLPSGGDAALALAIYVSGSQEEFVRLMNQKIDELGLSKTSHFTNCVGLYDANHYSTVYDISVILKAACDNSFCRRCLPHTHIPRPLRSSIRKELSCLTGFSGGLRTRTPMGKCSVPKRGMWHSQEAARQAWLPAVTEKNISA